MIATDTTRWIWSKIEADRAAIAAAQAIVEQEQRLAAAQASYTTDELIELADLAMADHDRDLAYSFAWHAAHLDHRYVTLHGWNFSRPIMLRPASVPAEVRHITGCVCESGSCCYCTCCELWNGEHSCEWDENHPQEQEPETGDEFYDFATSHTWDSRRGEWVSYR